MHPLSTSSITTDVRSKKDFKNASLSDSEQVSACLEQAKHSDSELGSAKKLPTTDRSSKNKTECNRDSKGHRRVLKGVEGQRICVQIVCVKQECQKKVNFPQQGRFPIVRKNGASRHLDYVILRYPSGQLGLFMVITQFTQARGSQLPAILDRYLPNPQGDAAEYRAFLEKDKTLTRQHIRVAQTDRFNFAVVEFVGFLREDFPRHHVQANGTYVRDDIDVETYLEPPIP